MNHSTPKTAIKAWPSANRLLQVLQLYNTIKCLGRVDPVSMGSCGRMEVELFY